ncbi:hypothetical protein, partial [Salinispora vitiensis]
MTPHPHADSVAELDASFYDSVPDGETTTDHDFDAWWSQRVASRPTTQILGVAVPIPTQVPAEIMLRPGKALDLSSDDADEIQRLLVLMLDLAGVDGQVTLDGWLSDGLGSEQLLIIFTWALINGMRPPGKPAVSFARVAGMVEDTQPGKAPEPVNRTGRRAASRTAGTSKPATRTRRTG